MSRARALHPLPPAARAPRRAAQVPVVLAVDNYQALHAPSGYHIPYTLHLTQGAPLKRRAAPAQVPVVFAVDNYQALHSPSGYGQRRTEFSRRALDPGELRVAAALRVLDGPPPAWGVDVAALTWGGSYSRARCQARRGGRAHGPGRRCWRARQPSGGMAHAAAVCSWKAFEIP